MNKTLIKLMVFPSLLLLASCGGEKTGPMVVALDVPVVPVLQQDVRVESEYSGQTYGESDIEINPRVDGIIQSINFTEGTVVKKGQLLYSVDALPYQSKVHQAEGELAKAQANLAKAESDLAMIEPLAKINAVSQRELVAAKANFESAKAQIKAAEASLENSKIELGYCRITAPISGIIGISKVRVGDYMRPGPMSVLNTISDLASIRVRFTISEQEYLRISREIATEGSALKGSGKSIMLKLSDGSLYPEIGQISVLDRGIDPTTGSMTLEAAFKNPDQMLRPGQYVKVLVVTDVRKEALVIPQRAVIEMQGIYQVYVVDDSSKVRLKIIQTGPSFQDAYVVLDGLKSGDKIALGGTSLLKNGSLINPILTEWKPGMNATKSASTK